MTEPHVAAPVPAPAERTSRWEDFIDVFYAPAEVFRRRASESFAVPLLVVALAMAVLAITNAGVLQPMLDAEFARQTQAAMRANPAITPEMLDRMKGFGEAIQRYGTIVVAIIGMLLVGTFTWLVAKLVDSKQTLHASIVVACYAWVAHVVEQIVYGIEGLLMNPDQLTSHYAVQIGPARFLDVDHTSPVVMALLDRLDLFTIWVTVLLAIGVYAVGKVSKQRATVAGVLFWTVSAVFVLLQALRQAATT